MNRIKKHIETIIKRIKTRSSNNKNKTMPGAKKILAGILIAMVVFSLYNLYDIQRDRSANQRTIDEAQRIFSMSDSTSENLNNGSDVLNNGNGDIERSIEYNEELIREPNQEILSLKERNEDVVGWINISNTNIDYPIVQAEDNAFYHRRDWLGNSSVPGSIFLDYRNSAVEFSKPATHSIIYGHHIRDGSMFQNLMKYKDYDFYEENRIIEITDLYDTHRFEIFSAYITTTEFYFIQTYFALPPLFTNLANEFIERSMHPTNAEITTDDHILTLVTCTYEYDDARFVVHARRID